MQATPALLQCVHALAAKTAQLLEEGRPLAAQVKDFRLGLEISVIQAFADRIVRMLGVRDPLSQRVHLGKGELLALTLGAVTAESLRRAAGQHPVSKSVAGA
jgi:hydroxysqualene synthase